MRAAGSSEVRKNWLAIAARTHCITNSQCASVPMFFWDHDVQIESLCMHADADEGGEDTVGHGAGVMCKSDWPPRVSAWCRRVRWTPWQGRRCQGQPGGAQGCRPVRGVVEDIISSAMNNYQDH